MSQQPTKIKLSLKRRASEISIDAVPHTTHNSNSSNADGTNTPPDGLSSSTSISEATGGLKIKKFKISMGAAKPSPPGGGREDAGPNPTEIKDLGLSVLKIVKEYQEDGRFLAEPFLSLPSKSLYPDYYTLIKLPISFTEISKMLSQMSYTTMEAFKSDFALVFTNCRTYNEEGSDIVADAGILENVFNTALSDGRVKPVKVIGAVVKKDSKRASIAPKVSVLPRPTDPLLLLFDSLARTDYKTFTETFPLVCTTPAMCDQMVPVTLFEHTFTWALMHAACYYGVIKAVDMLMEAGANGEVEDTWYKGRPFAWATFGGHPKLARILLDKWKVDRDAKNIHGQTAYDLLSDKNVAHWKALFAEDRKPTVFAPKAVVKPTPPKPVPITQTGRPSRNSYPTHNTSISLAQQAFIVPGSRTSSGASLGKAYPKRVSQLGPSVVQQNHQAAPTQFKQQVVQTPNPTPPAPLTQYGHYLAQEREQTINSALITSLTLSPLGDKKIHIPFKDTDPHNGYCGTSISINRTPRFTLEMELTETPFPDRSNGFKVQYYVTGHHGPAMTPLKISGSGELGKTHTAVIDNIKDGAQWIEIAITGTMWEEGEGGLVFGVHQTYVLFVDSR